MLYQVHNAAEINKIINTKRAVLISPVIFAFKKALCIVRKQLRLPNCVLIVAYYLEQVISFYFIDDRFTNM